MPTGIDRTCLAYIVHYGKDACAVIQRGGSTTVLSRQASRPLFDLLLSQGTDVRPSLLKFLLPGLLGLRTPDIAGQTYLNVGHTGLDKLGHAAWIERTGVKPVYFVHDLIPLTHPEYCRFGEPEKHLRRIKALLRHGAGIIVNSRDTLNELAIFSGLQQALHMPPSVVAPLGVVESGMKSGPAVIHARLPAKPYFVMLGTIEGRKNHLLILTLWAELARRLGAACPQLVIIGQRGWECEQAVDMLERSEAIRGHVIELPRCDDAMLSAYMRNARALLFPSFVEGYGLPLVEALAAGTPVIASDLAVFRELAAGIPDYLSPIDGLGWMERIENYARDDSDLRAAQLKRMSGWEAPSWEGHFARVDRWLTQLRREPGYAQGPSG